MKYTYYAPSLTVFFLLFILGCSSSSKSKKQNFVQKGYHNVTARDNRYFNGNLKLKESIENLEEGQEENFLEVLPVFKYGSKEQAQSVGPEFDEIIKKSSIAIQLHPKSKWVDDLYLLMGKSHFYKTDYTESLKTFQYLISKYTDKIKKKPPQGKKKKKNKKKKGEEEIPSMDKTMAFLMHHEKGDEAQIWVVRSLIEQKNFTDAQTALSVIRGDEEFPEKLIGELEAVQAHLLITQKNYKNAIPAITKAIEYTKNKTLLKRYNYILAQLHQETGNIQQSLDQFNAVLEMKPDYDMEFFAQASIIDIYRQNKMRSNKEIIKMIEDLLKDSNNEEFFGRIYYYLADISINSNNIPDGMKYLRESIIHSELKPNQKGLSYLRMADIEFEDEDYQPAYYHYDSCLMFIDKSHSRIREITKVRNGLKELVDYLKIIETEEQLQDLANMPEKDRNRKIDQMLEKSRLEAEEVSSQDFSTFEKPKSSVVPSLSATQGSDFYFYNQSLRSRGFSEFRRIWGKRKLADHWRRGNKQIFDDSFAEIEQPAEIDIKNTIDFDNSKLSREMIVENLPVGEQAKKESDERIIQAMFKVGSIYKENFENKEKAVTAFQNLLEKYPENGYRLQTLYNLYLLYETIPAEQQKYRNLILSEYPESVFAKVILDPDYFEKLKQKDSDINDYYATTYEMFEENKLQEVINRIKGVDSAFKENPIKPKFDMLDALVLGKQQKADEFKRALQDVVIKYPEDEVGVRAEEILNHLRRGSVIDRVEEAEPSFMLDLEAEHFVICIITRTGRDVIEQKNKISDYNTEYNSLDKLKVSSLLFGKSNTLLLVKSFNNAGTALDYYDAMTAQKDLFDNFEKSDYNIAVISRANYTQLYKKKETDKYFRFFSDNYLK